MQSIRQEGNYSFLFSRYAPVVATVEPGEIFEMYTEDAYCGLIREETDSPSSVERPGPNPQTGPVYVNGARPGDAIAVHIHSIDVTRDFGISQIAPAFGGLQATYFTAMLNQPLDEQVFKYVIDGNRAYHPRFPYLAFEIEPFMGTIATAPKRESLTTMLPFDQGGNMDVPDVKAGNTVYLPVAVDGALFHGRLPREAGGRRALRHCGRGDGKNYAFD